MYIDLFAGFKAFASARTTELSSEGDRQAEIPIPDAASEIVDELLGAIPPLKFDLEGGPSLPNFPNGPTAGVSAELTSEGTAFSAEASVGSLKASFGSSFSWDFDLNDGNSNLFGSDPIATAGNVLDVAFSIASLF
jgi:hypothetical protein